MKKIFKYFIFTLTAVFVGITVAFAGQLTPPGIPAKTMYTLGDLYTLINTGTTTASTDFVTPGSASPTFHSLTDLVNAFNGKIQTLSNTTTTVAYGVYASTTLNSIDTDLAPENIVSGKNIFGVDGTALLYPTEWSVDDPTGSVDWQTAVDYCFNLTEGGHTDWKLPTYFELVNAYLTSNPGNNLGFNLTSHDYWSRTEIPGYPTNVYEVNMNNGDSYTEAKIGSESPFQARCAR